MSERTPRAAWVADVDRMLRELGWHIHKQSAHTLARPYIDLTLPQMITLFAIHESGTCRMSALAEMTQQSAGTLTGVVDRLIIEGLVARVRNTTDRRVVEVTLTPAGEERLNQVLTARHGETSQLMSSFSADDAQLLNRLLSQLLEAYRQRDSVELERAVEA